MNPNNTINSDPATLSVQARPVNVPLSGYAKVLSQMARLPFGN